MLALSAALAIGASDFVWGRFILQDVSFGLVTGGVVGFVAAKLMPTGREHEAASHQKSLYALGIALATYGIAVLPPSGNGLIAVFVCAITLGILSPDIRDCFAAERRLPTTSASHRRAAMLRIGRPVRAGPGASTSSTWSGTPALLTPTIGLRSRRKSSAVGRRAAPGWWTPSGGRPARNSSRRSRGPIKSWMDIRRQVEDLAELAAGLRSALPRGQTLPEHAWRRRHRVILGLLWLHSVGLPIYGVARGYGIGHSLLEGAAVGVIAMLAIVQPWGRRGASALVSIGLISSSAILVHLSAGTIEAHFHFFVMIAVVALYEDWIPFLIAFAYVAVHHAVVGTLFPASVFSHPAAVANPLRWALIHAVFVFAAAIAAITGWRLNESVRAEAVRAQEELQESERELTEAQALAHLGSWTWDLGSNDVTWSPELYRLLGFHPGSRGANYERFFEAVHPDDRQALEQKLSHSISTFASSGPTARSGFCSRRVRW